MQIDTQILDFRRRVAQVDRLRRAGEPIPEGLAPSREEQRAVLRHIRELRGSQPTEAYDVESETFSLESFFSDRDKQKNKNGGN